MKNMGLCLYNLKSEQKVTISVIKFWHLKTNRILNVDINLFLWHIKSRIKTFLSQEKTAQELLSEGMIFLHKDTFKIQILRVCWKSFGQIATYKDRLCILAFQFSLVLFYISFYPTLGFPNLWTVSLSLLGKNDCLSHLWGL